jgi:hypothetical protein
MQSVPKQVGGENWEQDRKMRTLENACLGVVCLLTTSGAMPQTPRRDSEVLREDVLSVLELAADPAFAEIIRPYADCYAGTVVTSSASSLEDDYAVQSAEQFAQTRCKTVKQTSTTKAEEALAFRSPNLSLESRVALLRRVRRQATLFALMSEYQGKGRGAVFQAYLERLGREARAGRPVIMLSGE